MKQIGRLVINNDIQELEKISEFLFQLHNKYDIPQKLIDSMRIATDELIANTIFHGYEDAEAHHIEVRTYIDNYLTVVIEDDAIAFDPNQSPPPDLDSSLQERKIGGLGIHLVKNLINSFTYKRKDAHNVLILKQLIT